MQKSILTSHQFNIFAFAMFYLACDHLVRKRKKIKYWSLRTSGRLQAVVLDGPRK